MSASPDLLKALRTAYDTADAAAAWYLDLEEPRVIEVRDGRASVEDVTIEEIEDQEYRFVAVPALTPPVEYVWMLDFVDERGDARLSGLLDARRGAHERFAAAVANVDAQAGAAWGAYRRERLAEAVDAWLAGATPD